MKKIHLYLLAIVALFLIFPGARLQAATPDAIPSVSLSDLALLGDYGALNYDHIGLPAGASYHVTQVDWYQVQDGKIVDLADHATAGDSRYVMVQLASEDGEAFGDENHVLESCLMDGKSLSKMTAEQIAGVENEGTCADGYYYNYGGAGQYSIISICMTVTFAEPEPEPEKPVVKPAKPVLLLKTSTYGARAIKLSWNKITGAKSYVIYGSACGSKTRKLVTVKKNAYTVKKIGARKLKSHKVYKFYVVAMKGTTRLATSKTAHLITAKTKGKYANAVSVKPKKKTVSLAIGKSTTLGATVKIYKGKRHLGKDHGAKLTYISSDPRIVTVDQKGKIKAKKKGTVNIYIQDTSGIYGITVVKAK